MIPFYCVVQNVCKKCENIDFKKGSNEVEFCGVWEFVFEEKIDIQYRLLTRYANL